jgi:hypothetical protein
LWPRRQATWLVPAAGRGLTVAGQRRVRTGLRWSPWRPAPTPGAPSICQTPTAALRRHLEQVPDARYTLGKLQILDLRERVGGEQAAFHDRLVALGTPPPAIAARRLLAGRVSG